MELSPSGNVSGGEEKHHDKEVEEEEERKGQRFQVIIKLIHIHVEAIVPV